MSYYIQQKFQITDFLSPKLPQKKITVAADDDELRRLYCFYLHQHNFQAFPCAGVDSVHEHLKNFQPHLLLFCMNGEGKQRDALRHITVLSRQYPELKIVTIGIISRHDELKEILDLGVCGHIDRKLTRPRDIIEVVKVILNA